MRAGARAAIAITASLVACGGGDKPFPLDTLAPQALEAHCERAVRCGLYDNVSDCGSDLQIEDFPILPRIVHFQDPAIVASVGSGAMSYNQDVAAGCIAALAAVSCSRASEDVRVDDPPACDGLFSGHIADAGPCVFDDECSSGRCTPASTCESDYVCCIGTCASAPHTAAIGSACAIDSDCAVDAFCTGAGCMPLLAVGDVCSTSSDCGFDLVCVSPTPGAAGACQLAPLLGDACTPGTCVEIGARCGSAGTCIAVGLAGASCATDFDCGEDLVCDAAGTCDRAPLLGAACTTLCRAGSWCNNPDGSGGTCDAPLADTTMCESSNECQSGYCADGDFATTCIERPVCF